MDLPICLLTFSTQVDNIKNALSISFKTLSFCKKHFFFSIKLLPHMHNESVICMQNIGAGKGIKTFSELSMIADFSCVGISPLQTAPVNPPSLPMYSTVFQPGDLHLGHSDRQLALCYLLYLYSALMTVDWIHLCIYSPPYKAPVNTPSLPTIYLFLSQETFISATLIENMLCVISFSICTLL